MSCRSLLSTAAGWTQNLPKEAAHDNKPSDKWRFFGTWDVSKRGTLRNVVWYEFDFTMKFRFDKLKHNRINDIVFQEWRFVFQLWREFLQGRLLDLLGSSQSVVHHRGIHRMFLIQRLSPKLAILTPCCFQVLPSPSLTPEDCVRKQMEAIQDNDKPWWVRLHLNRLT